MIRRSDPRGRRFSPTIQGLEARLALSAIAAAAPHVVRPNFAGATAPRLAAPVAQTTAPEFPLRLARFTALFQGTYMRGPARQPGFAAQTYMAGGGNTSAFYHANIQIAIYEPSDPSQLAVGQANVIQKGMGAGGNDMVIDLTAVPGHVDKAGRPDLFTMSHNSGSGTQFTIADVEGTLQLIYIPSRTPPRGAPAGGRLGVVIRGMVGLNGVSSNISY